MENAITTTIKTAAITTAINGVVSLNNDIPMKMAIMKPMTERIPVTRLTAISQLLLEEDSF